MTNSSEPLPADLASAHAMILAQRELLAKEQAEKIYRLAQAQDQSWREKRRIRELEELRAKSGGVTIGTNPGIQQTGNASEDAAAKLQQAKQMLDNKLITDSEFESINARIISGL